MKQLAILNITPDSFSDGDQSNLDVVVSIERAKEFLRQGADFVDIGAESTRPGASAISDAEEWQRLKRFMEKWTSLGEAKNDEAIQSDDSNASLDCHALRARNDLLSLDSRNPVVIKQVFDSYGKQFAFLNDVTGLQNPELLKVVAEHIDPSVKLISMHSRGGVPPTIKAADIQDDFYEHGLLEDFKRFWDRTIKLCTDYGIGHERLVLDPGLGFAKNLKHSLEIPELIPKLKEEFGLPVLIGASRKSFLSSWNPDKDLDDLTRDYNKLCVEQGVDYLRNHAMGLVAS